MSHIVLFNKPYGVLCKFTDPENRPTLSDYIKLKNMYACGRLDMDSEGLLILTDDGKLQHRISDPKHKLPKTYWAQIENIPDNNTLQQLREGVQLNDGLTRPAKVRRIAEPGILWPRQPPIRERASIPTCWIELTITEGRNRQVRRMTAAVGHPTLRLIRSQIGNWSLQNLPSGQYQTLNSDTLLWHTTLIHRRAKISA